MRVAALPLLLLTALAPRVLAASAPKNWRSFFPLSNSVSVHKDEGAHTAEAKSPSFGDFLGVPLREFCRPSGFAQFLGEYCARVKPSSLKSKICCSEPVKPAANGSHDGVSAVAKLGATHLDTVKQGTEASNAAESATNSHDTPENIATKQGHRKMELPN